MAGLPGLVGHVLGRSIGITSARYIGGGYHSPSRVSGPVTVSEAFRDAK
jgi:hypothetical protein